MELEFRKGMKGEESGGGWGGGRGGGECKERRGRVGCVRTRFRFVEEEDVKVEG